MHTLTYQVDNLRFCFLAIVLDRYGFKAMLAIFPLLRAVSLSLRRIHTRRLTSIFRATI